MIKPSLFLVVLFSSLMLSCDNQYTRETKIFKQYLFENFQENIPFDEHTYLIISTFQCGGCVQKTLLAINEKVGKGKLDSITIITSNLDLIPNTLKNKTEVLLDTKVLFEQIGLQIANVTLVKSSNAEVVKIKVINLDEIEKVVFEEFK